MRRKLGLLEVDGAEEDQELITDLLQVMHDTGADFTNTFRRLANFPMPTGQLQSVQLPPLAARLSHHIVPLLSVVACCSWGSAS